MTINLKMRCYSTDSAGMMTLLFLTLTLLWFIRVVTFIIGEMVCCADFILELPVSLVMKQQAYNSKLKTVYALMKFQSKSLSWNQKNGSNEVQILLFLMVLSFLRYILDPYCL